jgi:hypothetical protein
MEIAQIFPLLPKNLMAPASWNTLVWSLSVQPHYMEAITIEGRTFLQ